MSTPEILQVLEERRGQCGRIICDPISLPVLEHILWTSLISRAGSKGGFTTRKDGKQAKCQVAFIFANQITSTLKTQFNPACQVQGRQSQVEIFAWGRA